MSDRIPKAFYTRPVLKVAPELLGQYLVRRYENGDVKRFRVTEVEAYNGTIDLACHSSKGRTKRTEIMYHKGGVVYMYLIYGMYWMLNIVTDVENEPSAVLIRGIEGISGPGRVGKALVLDRTFNGEDLRSSSRLWLEFSDERVDYITTPRIGIDYAGEPWISKPWRFVVKI